MFACLDQSDFGRSRIIQAPKVVTFGKGQRTVYPKTPRYYPEEDVHRPVPSGSHKHKPAKIRSSITPGTVLILVAGRYAGRRVVFLKSLPSGLLLVSGPYKVNGVPLRRVSQAYVIATSTKIDISGVKLPEHIDDKYFAKEKKKAAKAFLAKKEAKTPLPDAKKNDQKAVDSQLIPIIGRVELLKNYLAHNFTLRNGQYPHQLKF